MRQDGPLWQYFFQMNYLEFDGRRSTKHRLIAVSPCASCIIPLSLSFPVFKMGVVIPSMRWFENVNEVMHSQSSLFAKLRVCKHTCSLKSVYKRPINICHAFDIILEHAQSGRKCVPFSPCSPLRANKTPSAFSFQLSGGRQASFLGST